MPRVPRIAIFIAQRAGYRPRCGRAPSPPTRACRRAAATALGERGAQRRHRPRAARSARARSVGVARVDVAGPRRRTSRPRRASAPAMHRGAGAHRLERRSGRSPRAAPGARARPRRRRARPGRLGAHAGSPARRPATTSGSGAPRALAVAGVRGAQRGEVLARLVVADVEEVRGAGSGGTAGSSCPGPWGATTTRAAGTPQRARTSPARRLGDADDGVGARGRQRGARGAPSAA